MDKALWQAEAFLFYPLVNTITLVISRAFSNQPGIKSRS